MSVKFNCPACSKEYELEGRMGGRRLTCACGHNIEVPQAEDVPEGQKRCPECGNIMPENNVICMECGYNFQTGLKAGAENQIPEDEDSRPYQPNFWDSYGGLIRKAVVILFILLIGLGIYHLSTKKRYGISSRNPIGKYSELKEHLEKSRLVPGESEEIPSEFGIKGKLYRFVDESLRKESKNMLYEYVLVAVDESGRICAVGGVFNSLDNAIPGMTGSRTLRFLLDFWEQCGFPHHNDIHFECITHGKGRFSFQEYYVEIEDGQRRAFRRRFPTSFGLVSSEDELIVAAPKTNPKVLLRKRESFDPLPEISDDPDFLNND